MNFLEIVQATHREAKLPGAAPTSVAGQVGRAADLVAWTVSAWNDIQRENNGKWKWRRRPFTLDTVADTASYAFGSATDTLAAAAITRFKAWDIDDREPPLIYLVSEGVATQRELCLPLWQDFRARYRVGTHTAGPPTDLAVDERGALLLGSTPDAIYRVTGNYWRGLQTLVEDTDEPEMPEDFHELIPFVGLQKYGYSAVAREILARCEAEGTRLYDALTIDQSHASFSMTVAGPLA